jgi:hypothetical protein
LRAELRAVSQSAARQQDQLKEKFDTQIRFSVVSTNSHFYLKFILEFFNVDCILLFTVLLFKTKQIAARMVFIVIVFIRFICFLFLNKIINSFQFSVQLRLDDCPQDVNTKISS